MGKYGAGDYRREAEVMAKKMGLWADMFREAGGVTVPIAEPVPVPEPEPEPEADTGAGGVGVTDWPNEPVGFAPITDQSWAGGLGSLGWGHLDRASRSDIVTDLSGPYSSPLVLEHVYPVGFTSAGREPAVDWKNLGGVPEIFVGLWWKPSNPWHGHSTGINKVLFAMDQTNARNVVLTMRGPDGGPYYLEAFPEGHPAAQGGYLIQNKARVPVRLGGWHRVELLVALGTGVIRWWMDGTLAGDYRALNLSVASGFGELQVAPTWGGLGGPNKRTADSFRYARVYASGRR